MTQKNSIGPRGWAILTLAGGAALASPFLRPAQLKQHHDQSALDVPSLMPSNALGTEIGSGDPGFALDESARITEGQLSSVVKPSAIFRPSTTPSELPDWAGRRSALDELITSGTAASASFGNATEPIRPEPLQPWQDTLPTTAKREQKGAEQVAPQYALNRGERELSTYRDSPWQLPEVTLPAGAADNAIPKWSVESAKDARALVQDQSSVSNQGQPGGLVRATLEQTITEESTARQQVRPRNFVFQPGMRTE